MSARSALKYGHIERERRWLLATVPEQTAVERTLRIRDRYLTGTRLRLRLVQEVGEQPLWKLGQKVELADGSPSALAHTTMYLDSAEAAALGDLPGAELVKTRRILSVEGQLLAVDSFHDQLDGLLMAELDLGEDAPMPTTVPLETIVEVTNDERFRGAALALTSTTELRSMLVDYGAL